jgi:pentatricopeptide repeat protein
VCGSTGAIDKGKQIHDEIASKGFLDKDVVLGNALVDMYTKCGSVRKAREVLHELRVRNVVTWSILIAGFGQQGQCPEALNCFQEMESEGFSPDAITFISLLNACSYSGMVNQAQTYYANMTQTYGIVPNSEHHACMVISYGFQGHFEMAMSVMEMMSSSHYPQIWLSLLGACKKRGAVKFATMLFHQAMQLNDTCPYG